MSSRGPASTYWLDVVRRPRPPSHEHSESAVVAGQDVTFETYRHTEIDGNLLLLVRQTNPTTGNAGGRGPRIGFWMRPDGQVCAADEDEIADFFG